jgi:serine/arginine repetitive matrix protein 2
MFRKHNRGTQSLSLPTTSTAAVNAARVASNTSNDSRNAGLSAAAAAAALRIHEAPPTNPGEVVTERMLQRRRSASLTPSARSRTPDPTSPRPQLTRQDSIGSMTGRTFRSRSQSPAPGGRSRYDDETDVPPVPNLPNNVRDSRPAAPRAAEFETESQKPPAVRVAAFRVASQKRKDGDPSWHGRAVVGDASNMRTSDAPLARVPSTASHNSHARSASPSVNFSYPRSPSAQPPSPVDEQTLVFDPNTRRMVTRAELLAEERMLQAVNEQDAKKRQRASQPVTRSGSHLAKGTVGRTMSVSGGQGTRAPAAAAAAAAINPTAVSQAQAAPAPATKRVSRSNSHAEAPRPRPTPTAASAPRPAVAPPRPQQSHSIHEQEKVLREPSPVLEDEKQDTPIITREPVFADEDDSTLHSDTPEAHELEYDQQVARREALQRLDGLPAKAVHPEGRTSAHSPIELEALGPLSIGAVSIEEPSPLQGYAQPHVEEESGQVQESIPTTESPPQQQQQQQLHQQQPQQQRQQQQQQQSVMAPATRIDRTQSPSPVRERREPSPERRAQASPGRQSQQSPDRRAGSAASHRQHSDSPVRTARFAPMAEHLAVIHSPPARSASPRKSALKHSSSPTRHVSDDSSEASRDDVGPSRRRSVRVSFDDESTVVGEAAASSDVDSPRSTSQSKVKRWFGLGRSKDSLSPLEEDEMMQPRPALPLFSSVRERKSKEPEERAPERELVRPHGVLRSALKSPADRSESPSNYEARRRNEANISKYREPLPPVVQSVGQSPLSSDADDSDLEVPEAFKEPVPQPQPVTAPGQIRAIKEEAEHNYDGARASPKALSTAPGVVPTIAVLPSTPGRESMSEPDEFFDLPGQFPIGDEAKPIKPVSPPRVSTTTAKTTPASSTTPATTTNNDDDDESESDGSSIYSDAYEDLSDMDGDGFMSLDAVLTSSVDAKMSQKFYEHALSSAKESKKAEAAAAPSSWATSVPTTTATTTTATAIPPAEPASTDDWEKVKTYWRSLPTEKRKLLEREAMEEAGEEADLEEAVEEPKKAKKKKSMEQRISERQVIQQINPERVYQIRPGTKMPRFPDSDAPTSAALPQSNDGMKLRKSMRPGGGEAAAQEPSRATPSPVGGGGMRRTMRSTPEPTGPPSRPGTSHQGPRAASSQGFHQSTEPLSGQPSQSQALAAAMIKTMRNRANSDSSETSFTRARPASHAGFRSTMRGGSALSQAPMLPASDDERPSKHRFSLRGLSPPGSPNRRRLGASHVESPNGSGAFKSTLRSGGPTPTAETGTSSRLRLLTLGGKHKDKKNKKSKFTSRFDGSSDEDGSSPVAFRSRFADSSDEEDVPTTVTMKKADKKAAQVVAQQGQAERQQPQPQPRQQPPLQLRVPQQAEDDDSPDPDSSDNENHAETPIGRPPGAALSDITSLQRKRSTRTQNPPAAAAAVASCPSFAARRTTRLGRFTRLAAARARAPRGWTRSWRGRPTSWRRCARRVRRWRRGYKRRAGRRNRVRAGGRLVMATGRFPSCRRPPRNNSQESTTAKRLLQSTRPSPTFPHSPLLLLPPTSQTRKRAPFPPTAPQAPAAPSPARASPTAAASLTTTPSSHPLRTLNPSRRRAPGERRRSLRD